MLEPALEALAYVHGKGFVHGHMKPANIMAVDDQVKVSSDRLCRTGESSGGLRKPGVYDPPEMAGGAILPAGDIWSLGMTLVEALTQRLPVWEGTEQGEPILPETVPAPFLDFAHHCLRRDPQRRWTVAGGCGRPHSRPRNRQPAGRKGCSRSGVTLFPRLQPAWHWRCWLAQDCSPVVRKLSKPLLQRSNSQGFSQNRSGGQ